MAGRLLMLWFVFACALSGSASAMLCRIYGGLIPKPLTEAKLESQGFELLDPPEITEAEAQQILAAILEGEKVARHGARVEGDKVHFSDEVTRTPENSAAIAKFEAYLTALYHSSRQRLKAIPGPTRNLDGPRIDIRASSEGAVNPTAYDSGHVDGGYGTVAVALVGDNSIVQPTSTTEVSPPTGIPILMIGRIGADTWKIPPGYHRAPKPSEKPTARLFVQMLF